MSSQENYQSTPVSLEVNCLQGSAKVSVGCLEKVTDCQDITIKGLSTEGQRANLAENSTLSNSGPGSPMSVESESNNCAESGNLSASNKLQRLVVIYFNGVSCMGKSELLRRFSEWFGTKGITTRKVSLDKVAKGIMDTYKEENNYQGEEAFTLCIGPIFEAFHSKILESAESMASECAHGVLMIDDCSLAPTVLQNLYNFCQKLGSSVMFYKFYPDSPAGLQINENMTINLSFQFVLNLCYRVLNRSSHPTFNYCPEKKLQLVLSFVRVYSPSAGAEAGLEDESEGETSGGESVEVSKKRGEIVHKPIPIEFHQEKGEEQSMCEAMEEIKSKLLDCISKIVPFESPVVTAVPECREFVELLRKTDPKVLDRWVSFGRQEAWTLQFQRVMNFFM